VVFLWVFYCRPWPKAKYTFCCAPINRRMPFVNTMFLKMARQFSRGDVISFDWLCSQV
jgi:ATP-dependent RNA helicase SUPV3L1/SUV3